MIRQELNKRNQLILKLLYYSALRVSEVSKLRIKHISKESFDTWGNEVFNGKGGKDRSFFIK